MNNWWIGGKHFETWAQLTVCRLYFSTYFPERNGFVIQFSLKFVSGVPEWQEIIIGSGDGLALNRQQFMI